VEFLTHLYFYQHLFFCPWGYTATFKKLIYLSKYAMGQTPVSATQRSTP